MYCSKCGKEVPEGSDFCPACGTPRGGAQQVPPTAMSGLALASLVLGILGFLLPVIGPILAIALGVKALSRIRQDRTLSGEPMAIAGIVLGGVALSMSLLFGVMFLPALARAREQARKAVCISNLKMIGLGMMMYSQDYREYFPVELSLLYPSYVASPRTFICPSRPGVDEEDVKRDFTVCYEYVSGMTAQYDEECILMCDREGNHRGRGRKGEGRNTLFVSATVKWIRSDEWPSAWAAHEEALRRSRERATPPL